MPMCNWYLMGLHDRAFMGYVSHAGNSANEVVEKLRRQTGNPELLASAQLDLLQALHDQEINWELYCTGNQIYWRLDIWTEQPRAQGVATTLDEALNQMKEAAVTYCNFETGKLSA